MPKFYSFVVLAAMTFTAIPSNATTIKATTPYTSRERETTKGDPDYNCSVAVTHCAEYNKNIITIKAGADVASVKASWGASLYSSPSTSETMANTLKQSGTELIQLNNKENVTLTSGETPVNKMHSLIWIALDADNNIVNSGRSIYYTLIDDADNWKEIGSGSMTEVLMCSFFSDEKVEEIPIRFQEHKSKPGYYRIVEPYSQASDTWKKFALNHSTDNHGHYLYINATDADKVYIEPSVLGLNIDNYGNAAIKSLAYSYVTLNQTASAVKLNLFGKLADGVITFGKHATNYTTGKPRPVFQMQFSGAYSGDFINTSYIQDLVIKLPATEKSAVSELNSESAPEEYYNLQGVKVANPENGIFIRRQGSKTTKITL